MTVDKSSIQKLREKTSAGIMACKEALKESGGDFDKAVDYLRKKGLSAANKKSDRSTEEGLVAVNISGKFATLIELNSETDFVARNDKFKELTLLISKLSIDHDNMDSLVSAKDVNSGMTTKDTIIDRISVLGENIHLRNFVKLQLEGNGVISHYVHQKCGDGIGSKAAVVVMESDADPVALDAFGKQLAMHIVASSPECVSINQLEQDKVAAERAILMEQSKSKAKNDDVLKKIVDGRMGNYYQDMVLLEQVFVIDGKAKVAEILKSHEATLGAKINVKSFKLFAVGQSLNKE